jgi:WD40 repeat protein
MKLLSVVLLVVFIPLGLAHGQTPDRKWVPIWGDNPAQEAVLPNTLSWSLDSSALYFSVLSSNRQMKRYDVATNVLEDTSILPQTIELSSEQQKHFHTKNPVAYIAPNQDTFIYTSTFQAYALGEGGYAPYLYGIGSLKDQTFLPTRVNVFEAADIRWSDDSTALVIEQSTPYAGQEAITYVKSIGSTCSWNFCTFAEAYLTSLDTGETIYDLSPDGERILYTDFNGTFRLWDVMQDAGFGEVKNQGTALPVENAIGATFLPDRFDAILVVNLEGIERYDLGTKNLELINPHITSKWAKWVIFSPDNRWVAVLVGDDGGIGFRRLFVLPVNPDA